MRIETEYNEYGWKLTVTKSQVDGTITIRKRSRYGHHTSHNPMQLRLRPSEVIELKELLEVIRA